MDRQPTITSPSVPYLKVSENLYLVPVERGHLAYAGEVRRALAELSPEAIALQLPENLQDPLSELLDILPEIRLLVWKGEGREGLMMTADPADPMIEAFRTGREFGLPVYLVDDGGGDDEKLRAPLPDAEAARVLGASRMAALLKDVSAIRAPSMREVHVARRLQLLAESGHRVLAVVDLLTCHQLELLLACDLSDVEPPKVDPPVCKTLPLAMGDLDKVLEEIPYLVYLYENFRNAHGPEEAYPYFTALKHLMQRAATVYTKHYEQRINLTEWKILHQYAKNMARVRGAMRPMFRDLVIAAKGVVNDDYAAILFELACSYPPNQREKNERLLQPVDPELGESVGRSSNIYAELDGCVVRLTPCYANTESHMEEYTFTRRPRPSEEERRQWQMAFSEDIWLGGGICSWPPEDEFIENFFHKVRARAFHEISEGQSTIEEFSTSLMDGLDMRETMRNWHKKKIYVKRDRVPVGKVGPVVVIWKEGGRISDPSLWHECLYAENQNESDIAFYGTLPGSNMAGPGISRVDYQGILSVYPASGIPDLWGFPTLRTRWRLSSRILVAAAILLTDERFVAVLAPKPPDAELRQFARERGKALIYLPMQTFGKPMLDRARKCHILAGKRVRDWAHDYIGGI